MYFGSRWLVNELPRLDFSISCQLSMSVMQSENLNSMLDEYQIMLTIVGW